MKPTTRRALTVALVALSALALAASPALAHEDQVIRLGSFWSGVLHPVLGLDHFLAMVSVGIVSAQIGGRAIWTVPATFVAMMGIGYLLGRVDLGLGSGVEWGILASVIVLGTLIAAGRTVPLGLVFGGVAVFAVFHGYAHGAETPDIADAAVYAVGFLSGTAAIHLLGVLIGAIAERYERGPAALRVLGGVIALLGILFVVGVL